MNPNEKAAPCPTVRADFGFNMFVSLQQSLLVEENDLETFDLEILVREFDMTAFSTSMVTALQ